ncbi:MAG TPA: F0F1 ATP synthase subunit B [Acidimicrobiia bacterium]|nr:F0F1 ATP synthase subunit B [Acidimicrobiia bacterium]
MRIRLLIAVAAIALVGVVATPGVAQAKPKGEAEEECIKLLEDGKKIDDCQEAPSLILPAGNEIIWGGLAFVVLLLVMWKYALPPVRNMMKQREDRIREDLERAEQARTEAEGELANYRRQVADARNEAARIIEEARQSADEVRRQIQSQAEADAAETRSRAQEDIRLATDRAQADLQGRVADLSIELAEKIVERNLDRDTQLALVESYIGQVGNGNGSR